MKVDISKHQASFIQYLMSDNRISQEMAKAVTNRMIKFIRTHLPCSHCGGMLVDKAFYKSKVHTSRRFRMPVCKECYPHIYGSKAK